MNNIGLLSNKTKASLIYFLSILKYFIKINLYIVLVLVIFFCSYKIYINWELNYIFPDINYFIRYILLNSIKEMLDIFNHLTILILSFIIIKSKRGNFILRPQNSGINKNRFEYCIIFQSLLLLFLVFVFKEYYAINYSKLGKAYYINSIHKKYSSLNENILQKNMFYYIPPNKIIHFKKLSIKNNIYSFKNLIIHYYFPNKKILFSKNSVFDINNNSIISNNYCETIDSKIFKCFSEENVILSQKWLTEIIINSDDIMNIPAPEIFVKLIQNLGYFNQEQIFFSIVLAQKILPPIISFIFIFFLINLSYFEFRNYFLILLSVCMILLEYTIIFLFQKYSLILFFYH